MTAHKNMPAAPRCMTLDELKGWWYWNVQCDHHNVSKSPCRDCTPAFRKLMKEEGLCDRKA